MTKEGNSSVSETLSLPKGGGSLQGIGETFQPNQFTGTGNFSIPIQLTPGRDNFDPSLILQYSSGHGNGCFGLGWQLLIPRITRKTEKGLPRYNDEDVFVMSGTEDLVPIEVYDSPDGVFKITRYSPRIEGLFAKIERWINQTNGDIHWRATTNDNVVSIYGRTLQARIVNPNNQNQVYQWLLEESFDAKGNHILYEYAKDDISHNPGEIFEENRSYTQCYIRRIYYGNLPNPLIDEQGNLISYPDGYEIGHLRQGLDHKDGQSIVSRRYAFEVVFDYGDWDHNNADIEQDQIEIGHHPGAVTSGTQETFDHTTSIREDSFSSFRAGFELRTLRRCRRIMMFHHFKELGSPTLVRSTNFNYGIDIDTQLSFLNHVTVSYYQKNEANTHYIQRLMPTISFDYTKFQPQKQHYQSINAKENDLPPLSLRNPDTTLVDLFGDGMPDIVQSTTSGFHYWRNLGKGQLDQRHIMHDSPAGLMLSQPGIAFGDVGGDGKTDLLVHNQTVKGFYEMTDDGGWNSLHSFESYEVSPTVDLTNPDIRMVDLTGDGLPDLLLTTDNSFIWYQNKGKFGYEAPQIVPRRHDLNEFPDVYFNDQSKRVRLSDLTGDGLNDIVLLHDGRIDYWPNLGYGQFGKRITMKHAPLLGAKFNPARLFLVDINGTGQADLVYVDTSCIRFWFNQNGNGWSQEQIIHGTPPIHDLTSIDFSDFFGTGTTCLVWSNDYAAQPGSNYKVLDFCGSKKPYLLTAMSNALGTTTRVKYASSTKFFLEDEKNPETRWATHLPFPVQVVEKVETIDLINRTKHITQYQYHHGYFDGREREFRGFGRVDAIDTELFNSFENMNLHEDLPFTPSNIDSSFHSAPVLTKTWFHTGLYYRALENISLLNETSLQQIYQHEFYNDDADAFTCPSSLVPTDEIPHQAFRALKGAKLRTEVYALDGTDRENHPYNVNETAYQVTNVYSSDQGRTGVFHVFPYHEISYHYERNPHDPRINQQLNLKHDDLGNVLLSATISYPRRNGHTPDELYEESQSNLALKKLLSDSQNKTGIIITHKKYIVPLDNRVTGAYRHSLPCETKVFELTGITLMQDQSFSIDTILEAYENAIVIPYEQTDSNHTLQKRLIDWRRTYFRPDIAADDLDRQNQYHNRLPLGKIEPLGLVYESYQAVMSRSLTESIYNQSEPSKVRIYDTMLEGKSAAGYVEMDNYWWLPSGRESYLPNLFYLSVKQRDQFDQISQVAYDGYGLLPESLTNSLGQTISVVDEHTRKRNNYRVMKPEAIRDINHNVNEVLFDTLGLVIASAVKGKGQEGDSLDSVNELVPQVQLDNPLQYEQSLLGKATTRFIYQFSTQPVFVHSLTRETHHADLHTETTSRIHHQRIYFDGFWRKIQTKVLTTSGPAPERDHATGMLEINQGRLTNSFSINNRWLVSGWSIMNNKGNPVQKYEPYFTDSLDFEYNIKIGVSASLFYDPLQRVVATLHPDHTYEKVVFAPWSKTIWDAGDTVLMNPENDPDIKPLIEQFIQTYQDPFDGSSFTSWYDQRITDRANKPSLLSNNTAPNQKAALLSESYAETPTTEHLDFMGNSILVIADNLSKKHVMLQKYDMQGTLIATCDAKTVDNLLHDLSDTSTISNEWIGSASFRYYHDMAGRKLRVYQSDAGETLLLLNVLNQPCRTWDANGNETLVVYDDFHRQTELWVKSSGSNFTLAEKIIYGEVANDLSKNLNGKVWKTYDGAGLIINHAYDFKDNLLAVTRQLLKDGTVTEKRWPVTSEKYFDEIAALNQLEQSGYRIETQYNAQNQIIERKAPDGSIQKNTYHIHGQLNSIKLQQVGTTNEIPFINHITYNQKNQRQFVEYGNKVTTQYIYDEYASRLIQLKTKSNYQSSKVLFDLHYTHDSAANITHIDNKGQSTVFNHNQAVSAVNQYTYDALYRLTKATGREHEGMNACHYQLNKQKHTAFYAHPQPRANAQALLNFTETFRYDKAGNLEKISHSNSQNNWVRNQYFSSSGNKILTSQSGCSGESNPFTYDENGNLLQLAHLPAMQWNFKNQLISVQLNVSDEPDFAYYQYDSSGQRVRKTIVKKGTIEERIYVGGYEVYRKYKNSMELFRRDTIHIMDNQQRIALIETRITDVDQIESGPATRVRYQLSDHLNTCLMEVDDSIQAKLISYEEFYAYGGSSYLTYSTNATGLEVASRKRYRYSGKERDDETGLYYYGARYYVPWIGRWASCDPAGTNDSLNLYLFLRANPIRFTDKYGLDSIDNIKAEVNVEVTRNLNLELEISGIDSQIEHQQDFIQQNIHSDDLDDVIKVSEAQLEESRLQQKRIHLNDALKESDKKIESLHKKAQKKLGGLRSKIGNSNKKSSVLSEITKNVDDYKNFKADLAMAKAGEAIDEKGLLQSMRRFKADPSLMARFGSRLPFLRLIGKSGAFRMTSRALGQAGGHALGVFADTPMRDGGEGLMPDMYDPHFGDRIDAESEYFAELIKYKNGLRDTEPTPPWTPSGELNALGKAGVALQKFDQEHQIFSTAQNFYGDWLGDIYDDYHEWHNGATQ